MSRNGSGTYALPPGNPVTTGTTISSTTHNNTLSDIATALSDSLAKDGQTTPTANLPMGGYAHTGVGDATVRTQYAKVSQIQDGGYVTLSSVLGADTITATCAPAITAYAAGQFFTFVAAGANTGAVTLNINSLGAKAVTKEGATALAAGDIASGAVVCVEYDGTRFQLVGGRSVPPLPPLDASSGSSLIGFIQAGVGAVLRTVQDKLRERVSVKDFGAVGDGDGVGGGTDNTAAFAAAIATGKAVFVPEGIYRVDGAAALEASPAASLMLYGESGIHVGVSSGKTVIDLTNNTTYFAAVGYAPTIRDIVFKGGVDVIHYSSQGLDASTARLENVRALQWTGTFFKMFTAGNGSNIHWDRCVLISNNDSAIVFDNTALAGTTDSLHISKSWVETRSTKSFKMKVGRVNVSDTRFIPYTNSIDPSASVWFDFYAAAHLMIIGSDFGGESKRQIINWRADGGEIHLVNSGISSIAGNFAINLIGAPLVINFDVLIITDGQGNGSLINIDPTMSATSKALLSKCKLYSAGSDEASVVILAGINSTDDSKQLAAKLTHPETEAIAQVSDHVATGGSSWVSSSAATNVTVVTDASAPDALGGVAYGFKGTATADGAFFSRYCNTGPGVSTIPDGANTYELLCTVVGGFAKVRLLFGSDDTTTAQKKTFYVGPGIHHLCFPLYLTTGMTRNMGFEVYMNDTVEVTITRMRVCTGFYHKRKWEFYGSAAPVAASPLWYAGDRVINSTPTVAQPKAWVCTVAGGPGTWVSEGSL